MVATQAAEIVGVSAAARPAVGSMLQAGLFSTSGTW
jgi:hypothetical protein